jgi:hypothetical protein
MQLISLAVAATALLFPGRRIDRIVEGLSNNEPGAGAVPARNLCQKVSLALTMLLAVFWCGRAFLSQSLGQLLVSEGLLVALSFAHALVSKKTRLAEAALVFAGAGEVIHAIKMYIPAAEIISTGAGVLLVLWLGSYVLARTAGERRISVFGPAFRNVSHVFLTLILSYDLMQVAPCWSSRGRSMRPADSPVLSIQSWDVSERSVWRRPE